MKLAKSTRSTPTDDRMHASGYKGYVGSTAPMAVAELVIRTSIPTLYMPDSLSRINDPTLGVMTYDVLSSPAIETLEKTPDTRTISCLVYVA